MAYLIAQREPRRDSYEWFDVDFGERLVAFRLVLDRELEGLDPRKSTFEDFDVSLGMDFYEYYFDIDDIRKVTEKYHLKNNKWYRFIRFKDVKWMEDTSIKFKNPQGRIKSGGGRQQTFPGVEGVLDTILNRILDGEAPDEIVGDLYAD